MAVVGDGWLSGLWLLRLILSDDAEELECDASVALALKSNLILISTQISAQDNIPKNFP